MVTHDLEVNADDFHGHGHDQDRWSLASGQTRDRSPRVSERVRRDHWSHGQAARGRGFDRAV